MSLPGGMFGGRITAIGEGLPSNLFGAAKKAQCPHCSSPNGLLLWDHPRYEPITEPDMEALRNLWRIRCQWWWKQNNRSEGLCDRCSGKTLRRGEGYLSGSSVMCEECAQRSTDEKALSELQKNPDYFGVSELRRARNVQSGAWRLEPARVSEPTQQE
ncbi:MAG: hypothetical protein PHX83_07530 [Acidobacteriia bacterium]|nr:hypothetical protein [Terriglobia bacterium]